MKELVLDLSKWDENVDLKAWKDKHNLWGVIIKAGGNEDKLGRYTDPKLDEHYQKAMDAGLHIGYYYYSVSTTTANAKADAEHLFRILGDKKFDLPWYIDIEDPRQFKLSKRALTDVAKAFCDTLISYGVYSGLYTTGDAWLNKMYNAELLDYADWIAWWKADWPTEAGDIGMWQQGGIRFSDGNIIFDDKPGYHDCDWCCVDYPARIVNGNVKQTELPIVNSTGRASDVIDAAYGELGYYAPNDPQPGSRYGRWMAGLFDEDWLAGPSNEIWWCCMFVSWCLVHGGVKMDGFPTYNTDVALSNGAKKYAVDKYSVKYGDIVIFNWDWNSTTDHIGFATGEFDGTGFTTIEGNIGNAVKEKYRQMGNVAYVLRPPYEGHGVVNGNTPSVSSDPKNNRDGGKLDIDGIGGWNTIIDLQHVLGTTEDGRISGQYPSNNQYHWAMSNVDYNHGGSELVRALQKKIGADPDGQWGPDTSTKLQQWLVDQGYNISVDSYFGRESVKALQQSLNDGKWN